MTQTRESASPIERAIGLGLSSVGFERRASVFIRPVSEGVWGWLGINTGRWAPGIRDVNPVIGVRHDDVERLVSGLMDLPYRRWIPPSISSQLSYQMPAHTFVSFLVGSAQIETDIAPVVDAVREYGIPFVHEYADLENLARALPVWKLGLPEMAADRLPVVLALIGQPDEAIDALKVAEEVRTRRGLPLPESDLLRRRLEEIIASRSPLS